MNCISDELFLYRFVYPEQQFLWESWVKKRILLTDGRELLWNDDEDTIYVPAADMFDAFGIWCLQNKKRKCSKLETFLRQLAISSTVTVLVDYAGMGYGKPPRKKTFIKLTRV